MIAQLIYAGVATAWYDEHEYHTAMFQQLSSQYRTSSISPHRKEQSEHVSQHGHSKSAALGRVGSWLRSAGTNDCSFMLVLGYRMLRESDEDLPLLDSIKPRYAAVSAAW